MPQLPLDLDMCPNCKKNGMYPVTDTGATARRCIKCGFIEELRTAIQRPVHYKVILKGVVRSRPEQAFFVSREQANNWIDAVFNGTKEIGGSKGLSKEERKTAYAQIYIVQEVLVEDVHPDVLR